jgi:5-methylthioadenosine/S-adenosylhomocysteine deaminase
MIDLVIEGVTAVTIDADRRVLNNAWIAVTGDRISGIGTGAAPDAAQRISGRDFVAIPGLIDCHSHSGHGLVRAAGGGDGDAWFDICESIYARHSSIDFWHAEAMLTQAERLQSGVTTAISLLGGGADVMRTDDSAFGDAHCAATVESGLRTILAVGPGRLPFPKHFARLAADGSSQPVELEFEMQMKVCEQLIQRWNDVVDKRTGVCLILPVYTAEHLKDDETAALIRRMSTEITQLRDRYGVLFTQDGHREGSIALAEEFGLLGPHSVLSHSVDLTPDDFAALLRSGAHISHNPSAIMSILGRCPAPELIAAGVNVCISSDASAPDRGFDMFRHMAQAMHYHRRHFRDPAVLPEGKVLEMCTIDAARALGLDADLGSLEVGKKADIVLVDMHKPHLYPPVMPVTRLTHFANAADVDTVIVDGKVLMQGRAIHHLDVDDILRQAATQAERAFTLAGFAPGTRQEDSTIWGVSRRNLGAFRVSGSDGSLD